MKIETTRFGQIEIEPEQVITLKRGLIGFADILRYVIIFPSPDSALVWLQAVDDPNLAFVITTPNLFVEEYQIKYGRGVLEALSADDPSQLQIYVLVTIPQGRPEEMTGNLMGPLVVNPLNGVGEQLIVEDPKYTHKHPLIGTRKKKKA